MTLYGVRVGIAAGALEKACEDWADVLRRLLRKDPNTAPVAIQMVVNGNRELWYVELFAARASLVLLSFKETPHALTGPISYMLVDTDEDAREFRTSAVTLQLTRPDDLFEEHLAARALAQLLDERRKIVEAGDRA